MRLRQNDYEHTQDAALLAACLTGNEDAWSQLVERYTRLVYSIALKSGLSEQDSAEVVQNVFIIVLRRLESLQDASRFSAWLITTTHRESWRLKKSLREHALNDDFELIDDDDGPAAQVVAWDEAAIVHRALHRLDGRCRQLLTLLFLDGSDPGYKEISANLGISMGSIGPIRGRCLKRLKVILAEYGVSEDAVGTR